MNRENTTNTKDDRDGEDVSTKYSMGGVKGDIPTFLNSEFAPDRPAGRARNERKPGAATPRDGLHEMKQGRRAADTARGKCRGTVTFSAGERTGG